MSNDMHVSNEQNVAFIADEEEDEYDSTVESLTNVIVLSDDDDAVDGKRNRKLSYFMRVFFLGGCRSRSR